MTPEGKVKAKVNKALEEFGPLVYRFMPVQNGMGAPGLDYFLCVNGHFVSIETKAKGGKLTPRQELTKQKIEAAGGWVFVVYDDASLTVAVNRIRTLIHACHHFEGTQADHTARQSPGSRSAA